MFNPTSTIVYKLHTSYTDSYIFGNNIGHTNKLNLQKKTSFRKNLNMSNVSMG